MGWAHTTINTVPDSMSCADRSVRTGTGYTISFRYFSYADTRTYMRYTGLAELIFNRCPVVMHGCEYDACHQGLLDMNALMAGGGGVVVLNFYKTFLYFIDLTCVRVVSLTCQQSEDSVTVCLCKAGRSEALQPHGSRFSLKSFRIFLIKYVYI